MKQWITKDPIRFVVVAVCIILMAGGYIFNVCNEKPVVKLEQVAPAATNGFEIVVVTEPRFTSEVPPAPIDSIILTNGESQLRDIISRRKPKSGTNVVSPAR